MIECPKCHKRAGVIEIGGKRPGWECRSCGLFYAKQTWEIRDETLKRRHPKPAKKKRSYVDWTAVSGRMPYSSVSKADDSDDVAELIDEGWV